MKAFLDSTIKLPKDRPWLILGKGPSFSRKRFIKADQVYIFGLNHVADVVDCDIAHAIDIDAVTPGFLKAHYTVVPWHPHIGNLPSKETLTELVESNEILTEIDKKGRLLTYNCSSYKKSRIIPNSPKVKARFFSAEAAFRLLALSGVKFIYSAGIDGGNEYAAEFKHLKPLTNGQKRFDKQFREIEETVTNFGIQYKAL